MFAAIQDHPRTAVLENARRKADEAGYPLESEHNIEGKRYIVTSIGEVGGKALVTLDRKDSTREGQIQLRV